MDYKRLLSAQTFKYNNLPNKHETLIRGRPEAGSMLVRRLRRWSNIDPTSGERFVLAATFPVKPKHLCNIYTTSCTENVIHNVLYNVYRASAM